MVGDEFVWVLRNAGGTEMAHFPGTLEALNEKGSGRIEFPTVHGKEVVWCILRSLVQIVIRDKPRLVE